MTTMIPQIYLNLINLYDLLIDPKQLLMLRLIFNLAHFIFRYKNLYLVIITYVVCGDRDIFKLFIYFLGAKIFLKRIFFGRGRDFYRHFRLKPLPLCKLPATSNTDRQNF